MVASVTGFKFSVFTTPARTNLVKSELDNLILSLQFVNKHCNIKMDQLYVRIGSRLIFDFEKLSWKGCNKGWLDPDIKDYIPKELQ